MQSLTEKEASLKKRAWNLVHRLDAVSSKDAKTVRELLDKLAEYHIMLSEGAKNTEQNSGGANETN